MRMKMHLADILHPPVLLSVRSTLQPIAPHASYQKGALLPRIHCFGCVFSEKHMWVVREHHRPTFCWSSHITSRDCGFLCRLFNHLRSLQWTLTKTLFMSPQASNENIVQPALIKNTLIIKKNKGKGVSPLSDNKKNNFNFSIEFSGSILG